MKAWHSGLTNSGMVKVCDADGNIICLWGRSEETIKRANLIAALPELCDILIEILGNAVVNGVYREKAEKVLEKARGEK